MEIRDRPPMGGVTRLALSGRLDPTTVGVLDTWIGRVLAMGAKKVLLDLEELDYISSAGLRVLLQAAKKISVGGGRFMLCEPQRSVKQVLDIAGFSSMMSVYATEAEALDQEAE